MAPASSLALIELGRALREFRLRSGLSQEALGLESGLDRSYVGGVERGERNPSYVTLLQLAAALEVRASVIIVRAEETGPPSDP